jgi:hypothetical protein
LVTGSPVSSPGSRASRRAGRDVREETPSSRNVSEVVAAAAPTKRATVRVAAVRTRPVAPGEGDLPLDVEVDIAVDLEAGMGGTLHFSSIVRSRRTGHAEACATLSRAERGVHTLAFRIPSGVLGRGDHAIDVEAILTVGDERVAGAVKNPAATVRIATTAPPRPSCASLDAVWLSEPR